MINAAIRNLAARPRAAALTGLLSVLPLVTLNAIVAKRVEPFFSLIRPGAHTSLAEYVLLPTVLLLLPLGAFCALRPVLQRATGGKRSYFFVNGAIAALLLAIFTALSIALGSEIYACEILRIPNCD